ncbi:hypothetical protein BC826DRAFT_1110063 [Russula brevipes]|nr:hypothetical protein BC826DRAFT_1110063 [Russula brevipes]
MDYEVLAFVDNDELLLNENTQPVLLCQGDWYELEFSKSSKTPYLGVQRDDIHAYDVRTPSSSEDDSHDGDNEDSSSESKDGSPGCKNKSKKVRKNKGKKKASMDEEIWSLPVSPEMISQSSSKHPAPVTPIQPMAEVFTPETRAKPKVVTVQAAPQKAAPQTNQRPLPQRRTTADVPLSELDDLIRQAAEAASEQ